MPRHQPHASLSFRLRCIVPSQWDPVESDASSSPALTSPRIAIPNTHPPTLFSLSPHSSHTFLNCAIVFTNRTKEKKQQWHASLACSTLRPTPCCWSLLSPPAA